MANPFRYRGYYYDLETGFYYLNSRYYDPAVGRFINADRQLNTSQGVLGTNMFAYCLNNPINKVDYDGHKPGDLFDTIDEAARDAALYMNELGTFDNTWEYATSIYKTTTTKLTMKAVFVRRRLLFTSWTEVQMIPWAIRETKYTYKKVTTDKKATQVEAPNAPLFKKRVAAVHTHPYVKGYGFDTFSNADMRWAIAADVPIYLYGANGYLRKYDPDTALDITIFADLPKDPKFPG